MIAVTGGQERAVAPAPDRRELLSISHYHNAEHLANERTHLAYMRTAIAVISLGITMNRFSRFLFENEQADRSRRLILLRSTSQIGLGMVLFGCLWMMLALHRYRRVERAIDNGDFQSQRRLVEWLTLIALIGAALGIIWMFLE